MDRNGARPPALDPPPPVAPLVQKEGALATGERFRPYALAGLTLALIVGCVLLTVPFLPAVTWGVALALLAWPLGQWVRRRVTADRTRAAALTSAVVVGLIVVPSGFVGQQLAREAAAVSPQAQQEEVVGTIRQKLRGTPVVGDLLGWAERSQLNLEEEVRKAARSFIGDGVWLARGSLAFLIQAAVAVYILFFVLRDGEHLVRGVRQLLPVTGAEADRLFDRAAGSVHANLYAALVTSLIDAASGTLVFWAVGLPSPVLWGVVVFVLSMLPVAGIFLIWLPASIYMGINGQWGGAAALVAWGVAAGVLVDTVLYTKLAG
ncbi:MAG: AI-2E family transporter, partial [Gemmataceae bacterium]|nr:AI-2E family transporter [Gemmataceae bacterium]